MGIIKYTFIGIGFLLISCEVKQKEIDYGNDHCSFCQMTIVDKQHAAQIITKKGKAYNFDAIECMVHYTKNIDTTKIGLFLSSNYNISSSLINAKECYFIISENIPSPMGAFLSAVPSKADALTIVQEKGGAIYNWMELLEKMNSHE
ncbi:MAG: nitrous oxide reductase accessory protein NosL [Flavobacteriaceae bacterium]